MYFIIPNAFVLVNVCFSLESCIKHNILIMVKFVSRQLVRIKVRAYLASFRSFLNLTFLSDPVASIIRIHSGQTDTLVGKLTVKNGFNTVFLVLSTLLIKVCQTLPLFAHSNNACTCHCVIRLSAHRHVVYFIFFTAPGRNTALCFWWLWHLKRKYEVFLGRAAFRVPV